MKNLTGIKTNFIWVFYSLTICLGAFLMFLIQPLVGKIITPQYGGVSQVWCLCLLFFQLTLLLGYTLTYFINYLNRRFQAVLYILLMGISILLVHVPTGNQWMPKNQDSPVFYLLLLLLKYLAVPSILLSTVSIIHQNWFKSITDKNPYHLYSLSNFGSLAALIFYPILIEPNLSVSLTLKLWTGLYWILAIFSCISSLILLFSYKQEEYEDANNEKTVPIPLKNYVYWLLLSFLGTGLLISFTNHITHDIAPVPLFWVVPLALYLLTFILCFSSKKLYNKTFFIICSHILLFFILFVQVTYLYPEAINRLKLLHLSLIFMSLPVQIMLNMLCLFCLCMVCNGEIYDSRPNPEQLSIFYLTIALGGAIGGIFVNIIAPNIFSKYSEFPLIIIMMVLFTTYQIYKYNLPVFRYNWTNKAYVALLTGIAGLCIWQTFFSHNFLEITANRNFYGTISARILPSTGELGLFNGSICHGSQFINFKNKNLIYKPTAYYTESSAIGIANRLMRIRKNGKPLKICNIGLGIGTVAYYGRKGDSITFYELNPAVPYVAKNLFSFLKNTKANINIILGDGRLSLQKQPSQKYDIIMVDAFNNDAIPVHLLSKEAINLYLKHLNKDGLILFNISNKYLHLEKVLSNLAISSNLSEISIESHNKFISVYSVISRDKWFPAYVSSPKFKKDYPNAYYLEAKWYKDTGIWTDDYSNIISIINGK